MIFIFFKLAIHLTWINKLKKRGKNPSLLVVIRKRLSKIKVLVSKNEYFIKRCRFSTRYSCEKGMFTGQNVEFYNFTVYDIFRLKIKVDVLIPLDITG